MTNNHLPDWFLETVQAMLDAERDVRSIDVEFKLVMGLEGLDPRLQTDLQHFRDALGTVKVSLSVMDMTARKLLAELSGSNLPNLKPVTAH